VGDAGVAVLVYLYGPPAVGKLTIARRVAETTGFRLFHNHLTVDAVTSVFEFGSPPFVDVLHRLRFDVFETAARQGIDLVFTNSSMSYSVPRTDSFLAFAHRAAEVVDTAGGTTLFVRLTAPVEVLCDRVDGDDRRALRKLVDADRLRSRLEAYPQPVVNDDDLVIDTSTMTADEAAQLIIRTF
jgi:chloramphenicol 3-O-phosphotransferase